MTHPHTKFCPSCHSFTDGKKETRGHFLIEVFMWLLFLFPGIIYSLWRQTSKHITCTECGASDLISYNAPKAKQVLGERYDKNLASFRSTRHKREKERLSSPNYGLIAIGAVIWLVFVGFHPKTVLSLSAVGGVAYFVIKKKQV